MNYSHFLVRRLMSEQIADTMAQVTGVPLKFPTQPLGKRAMSIPVLNFGKPDYMMKVFGRNDLREVICERDTKPSVAQVMHLVSGETIQKQITAKDGNLDAWLADASLTDRQIVENIYLAALTRKPGEDEVSAASGSAGARRSQPGGAAQGIRGPALDGLQLKGISLPSLEERHDVRF